LAERLSLRLENISNILRRGGKRLDTQRVKDLSFLITGAAGSPPAMCIEWSKDTQENAASEWKLAPIQYATPLPRISWTVVQIYGQSRNYWAM